MASSKQGKVRDEAEPVPTTGRTFASMDPERVREVVPAAQARGGAQHEEPPPASEADHVGGPVRVRPVTEAGGNEGGSRRR